MNSALILVDIQNDFVTGSLPVPQGQQIIPVVDRLVQMPFDLIVATRDWHPSDHGSFAINHARQPGEVIELEGIDQILWPVHCVQNTLGAELVPGWDSTRIKKTFFKGTDSKVDSYSTFFDNSRRRATGLGDYLLELNIKRVFFAGLATDYCVKYSAMDARDLGFETYIVTDACRGINLKAGDVDRTLEFIVWLGGHLCTSQELPVLLTNSG